MPSITVCDRKCVVSSTVIVGTLGDLIRLARDDMGLTQKGLGEALGVGQPAVCGWERNRARPNAATLDALSNVLSVDLGDLTRAAGVPLEYPRGSTVE